ncbi:hypothetical protein KSP39_PZI012754 [Platanthera zijinensis]|uniref:Uncharacterized protein n=1 Tax=Platanthera zijinensis TaxID=2320716 RepID=A0AAP0BF67_9ASPA
MDVERGQRERERERMEVERGQRERGQRERERMEVELLRPWSCRPWSCAGHGTASAMELRRPWSCYGHEAATTMEEVLAGATEVARVASTAVALELSEHGGRAAGVEMEKLERCCRFQELRRPWSCYGHGAATRTLGGGGVGRSY